jgi:c-di-GMP-binding flagellar brake protein YcgR
MLEKRVTPVWNSPNQRNRSGASGKKKDKNRKSLHIKRVLAKLEYKTVPSTEPLETQIRMVLNDISVNGVEFFSPIPLDGGQDVILSFQHPQQIKIQSKVAWCQEATLSNHILTTQSYTYRVGVEFVPATDAEKEELQKFCDFIINEFLFSSRTV